MPSEFTYKIVWKSSPYELFNSKIFFVYFTVILFGMEIEESNEFQGDFNALNW